MIGAHDLHEARSRPSSSGAGGVAAVRTQDAWQHMVIAGLLAPATLLAFVMLGDFVRRGQANAFDSHVRSLVLAHRPALLQTVFRWITTVGSVTPMVVYAIAAALLLVLRGRPLVAATVLVAPAAAVVAYLGLKNVFARNRPSGIGNVIEGTYSLPSAHATTSVAVCCTLAYVCWRERILRGPAALALCIITPALVGGSRVLLDVHWVTDVLGGWLAGLCIAALAALLYLLTRRADARRPLNELRT